MTPALHVSTNDQEQLVGGAGPGIEDASGKVGGSFDDELFKYKNDPTALKGTKIVQTWWRSYLTLNKAAAKLFLQGDRLKR